MPAGRVGVANGVPDKGKNDEMTVGEMGSFL
jgi:hypothetical protein